MDIIKKGEFPHLEINTKEGTVRHQGKLGF